MYTYVTKNNLQVTVTPELRNIVNYYKYNRVKLVAKTKLTNSLHLL